VTGVNDPRAIAVRVVASEIYVASFGVGVVRGVNTTGWPEITASAPHGPPCWHL
jgi:hypothetical protein